MLQSQMLSQLSPSLEFVTTLRDVNILLGLIAFVLLVVYLGVPRWNTWDVPTRLGWMSLLLFCFTVTFSSFEIHHMDTYFRVPMGTVALVWAIIAALWPRAGRRIAFRKRRNDS